MRKLTVITLFTALLPIGGAATAAPTQVAAEPSVALEEIVVTASKREEKLSNVPSSVSAVTSATIEKLGIAKLDDYIGLIPNLTQFSQGAPGSSAIIIRGLFTGSSSLSSTTAYYLDDAALSASGAYAAATAISPDADLADVERVEVLKGPQGTLYGANALGGILRVISKKPDPTQLSGRVGADVSSIDGGGVGYGIRGSLNLPIIEDKAAMRVNLFRRQDAGYYDNVGTGRKDVNEALIEGGRVAFRLLPSDRWTIDLAAFYQSIKVDSFGFEHDNPLTFTPAFGQYQFSSAIDPGNSTRFRTFTGNLAYRTDVGTLSATATYSKYESAPQSDLSAIYAPFIASFAEPGASIFATTTIQSKKVTEEVRFASNRLGRFEFLLGAFHTNEDDLYLTDFPIVNPDGSIPAAFGGSLIYSPNAGTYKETAGFGDVTFYLTDRLDVTGGFRYSKNKQVVDSKTFGFFSLFFPNAVYDFDDSAKNYLATLRYRPTENTNLYLRAASGYRPGGPNIGAVSFPPFKSDTVWNYEVGLKGSLAQATLLYEVAIYRINWKDVQLPGQDPVTTSQITTNGGSAHVDGAELELTLRPLPGLSVTGAFGYNKTQLTRVAADVSGVIGATRGDPFPLASKWTASLTADYSHALSGRVDGSIGATYQGLGDRNSTFPQDPTGSNVRIPGFSTINLRAGMIIDKRYRLNARVENITGKEGVQTYSTSRLFPGQPGVYSTAIRIRPRTFVVGVDVDF